MNLSVIDDSFDLLSSQTPKIDPSKTKSKKAPKLTLKTTRIRRSSIFNNAFNNCTAFLVSSSSTENCNIQPDFKSYPSTPKLLDDEVKLLDDLYGFGWRETQEHLFPKTERKGFKKKNCLNVNNLCKSETKKYLHSKEVKLEKKDDVVIKSSDSDSYPSTPKLTDDGIKLLDDLYGFGWRESQKHLFPKTEKKVLITHKNFDRDISDSDKENHRKKIKKKLFNDLNNSNDDLEQILEKKSFLESLSKLIPIEKCDPSARIYRDNFKANRNALIDKLKMMYNKKIFDGQLENVPIEWSEKMLTTAGFCYCKKLIHDNKSIERSARIVLSTKIIDTAERLRDVLIHEMCHAAAWVIDLVTNGHGPIWKKWTIKACTTFPDLPPITTRHNYDINTKYTYECTGCGYSFGRHSKSVDLERKRCGCCYGTFKVLINRTFKGQIKSVPVTPNKMTPFAKFVKENYKLVKTESLQHGDVMKLLGKQFKELKMKE